ncbi:hypothetical protein AAT19DRAFT_13078 [Rhodotorula toruloides]|uniref:Macrofage activating glycoprotein n=1 Tax=Rhodotorula toruloides TaxID=5286 RepID=A0A2T0ADG3_RHOTO|nr:hypothetical protein AAT19DRAFT_13078 [Rhodotorula toruloides]
MRTTLALATAACALAGSSLVAASSGTTITAAPSSTQIAKAVLPAAEGRGPQSGYNICNATTSGPDSRCQTMIANNASDFCLWGSPTMSANGTIGDDEAAVVAYCTNDQHGARIIPAGAITGLQWTGHINMSALNLQENDTGGELDPHGADLAGNPLGGLVYSNQLPGGNNQTEVQAVEWNNFIGSGVFCLKLCFDNTQNEPFYCQNKFDLLGCSYNMPAAYQDNVFLECDGDLQDPVGIYTGTNGQTTTWSQPESLAGTQSLPWTPRVPSSSNCKTYQSTELFPATALGYQSTSAPTATSAGSPVRAARRTRPTMATSLLLPSRSRSSPCSSAASSRLPRRRPFSRRSCAYRSPARPPPSSSFLFRICSIAFFPTRSHIRAVRQ